MRKLAFTAALFLLIWGVRVIVEPCYCDICVGGY